MSQGVATDPAHITHHIPYLNIFAGLLGKLLREVTDVIYGKKVNEIVQWPEFGYTTNSFYSKVWVESDTRLVVVTAIAPMISACFHQTKGEYRWSAIPNDISTGYQRGLLAGLRPSAVMAKENGISQKSSAMLNFEDAGARTVMAVPGLGGFDLELKYCSRRSESLHSEQPPSKVFYDAYYTYPVLSSKKHKQHFLLELSFPSQPPPPFGPFLQGPIHFYQPDLTAPLSVHHLKSNPEVLQHSLFALSHHLTFPLDHPNDHSTTLECYTLRTGDIRLLGVKHNNNGDFKTVLEVPAIERRGLYSPLTQEWLAETPEQQQQLSHINHKRAMLPGPQWMKCFKPVGSTGFDCHETDPMSRFRRAGFRFSTSCISFNRHFYSLNLFYDQTLSDSLARPWLAEPPTTVVYQATCQYTQADINGCKYPHADFYEIRLVLPASSHAQTPSQPHVAQPRTPYDPNPPVFYRY